jgi:hypothetical protein
MDKIDILTIVSIASFGSFLWLGLYIISRASARTPLTVACFLGMLAQSGFFVFSIMVGIATEREHGTLVPRLGWWANVIPPAFWFHICSLVIRRGPRRKIFTWPDIFIYLAAIIITLVGTLSDLFMDYSGATLFPDNHVYVNVGSLYYVFILYSAVACGGSFLRLLWHFVKVQQNGNDITKQLKLHIGLLTGGALMFLVGSLYLSINFNYRLDFPQYPAYSILLVGLLLCSYAVINYEMLLSGKAARRDFIYSFSGVMLMNLLYAFPIALLGVSSAIVILVLVGFVTTTHTIFDFGRSLMDKLFFTREEQIARSEARSYAIDLATIPVATPENKLMEITTPSEMPINEAPTEDKPTRKTFRDTVRKAITSLKNPPQLINSPLLTLKLVEQRLKASGETNDNRLNRAAALKSLLVERIERLRPAGSSGLGTTDTWRFYNSLYFPYVLEISKKHALAEARRLEEERRKHRGEVTDLERVLEWISDVDEDTFYKWQRRASDTIADILYEEELTFSSPVTPQTKIELRQ